MKNKLLTPLLIALMLWQPIGHADTLRPVALAERSAGNSDWQRIRAKQAIEVGWIQAGGLSVFQAPEDVLGAIEYGGLVPVTQTDDYRVLLDRIELADLRDNPQRARWEAATPAGVKEEWGKLISNPKVREAIQKRGYDPDHALPLCYVSPKTKILLEKLAAEWKKRLSQKGLPTTDEKGNSLKLIVTSVVRDNAYQQSLRADPTKPAAEVSSHTVGIAFDILRSWLDKNKPAHAAALKEVLEAHDHAGTINLLDETETGAWHIAVNPAPETRTMRLQKAAPLVLKGEITFAYTKPFDIILSPENMPCRFMIAKYEDIPDSHPLKGELDPKEGFFILGAENLWQFVGLKDQQRIAIGKRDDAVGWFNISQDTAGQYILIRRDGENITVKDIGVGKATWLELPISSKHGIDITQAILNGEQSLQKGDIVVNPGGVIRVVGNIGATGDILFYLRVENKFTVLLTDRKNSDGQLLYTVTPLGGSQEFEATEEELKLDGITITHDGRRRWDCTVVEDVEQTMQIGHVLKLIERGFNVYRKPAPHQLPLPTLDAIAAGVIDSQV